MALETGTFISDLVTTNPVASDALAFADDHLRLIKSTIKTTFPNIAGAVTKTHAEINTAVDQAAAALARSGGTMTGAITLAGDAASALHAVPKQQLDAVVLAAKLALYPVGSIYTNASVATNPATLLGFGTWAAFGSGRVLVGIDAGDPDFDTAEETGGSKTHSHTTNTVSDHTHSVPMDGWGTGAMPSPGTAITSGRLLVGSGGTEGVEALESIRAAGGNNTTGAAGAHSHTVSTSSSVQPYITVYMWKRTA